MQVRSTRPQLIVAVSGLVVTAMLAGTPAPALAARSIQCAGRVATIVGTVDDDVLVGTAGPDVIHGLGGSDLIRGLEGDDTICGGPGADTLHGGPGDDVVFGGSADDLVRGGAGYDYLRGGDGRDEVRGGAADDLIFGNSGADVLRGGYGADLCRGGAGNDDAGSCNEPASADASELQAGESLLAGQSIASPNGAFRLTMRFDGNVVLADGSLALWDSDTAGNRAARLTMTPGGSLVVSAAGEVIWESGTAVADAFVRVRNNANLVVFSPSLEQLWDRRTNPGVPDWHLPWPASESWKAGAPHGTNNGSLDFGPVGGVGDVAAVASGTVGWYDCQSGGRYLKVEHGDGWMSTYYHLANLRTELVGRWVEAGTVLGTAAQAVPCGGRSTFAHVHLVIWRDGERQTADGLSIGGFTVHAGSKPYWGHWTEDATGATVVINEDGAACCLTN